MDIELRWKTKSKVINVSIYPDVIGSPTRPMQEFYKVLEFRYLCSMRIEAASEWQEVPHVGIDED